MSFHIDENDFFTLTEIRKRFPNLKIPKCYVWEGWIRGLYVIQELEKRMNKVDPSNHTSREWLTEAEASDHLRVSVTLIQSQSDVFAPAKKKIGSRVVYNRQILDSIVKEL